MVLSTASARQSNLCWRLLELRYCFLLTRPFLFRNGGRVRNVFPHWRQQQWWAKATERNLNVLLVSQFVTDSDACFPAIAGIPAIWVQIIIFPAIRHSPPGSKKCEFPAIWCMVTCITVLTCIVNTLMTKCSPVLQLYLFVCWYWDQYDLVKILTERFHHIHLIVSHPPLSLAVSLTVCYRAKMFLQVGVTVVIVKFIDNWCLFWAAKYRFEILWRYKIIERSH